MISSVYSWRIINELKKKFQSHHEMVDTQLLQVISAQFFIPDSNLEVYFDILREKRWF